MDILRSHMVRLNDDVWCTHNTHNTQRFDCDASFHDKQMTCLMAAPSIIFYLSDSILFNQWTLVEKCVHYNHLRNAIYRGDGEY